MKTIGLIGGTTWHSTADYYRLINEKTQEALGRSHSAKIILHSVDFQEILNFQQAANASGIENILIHHAQSIEKAGADCLMLGANTMHRFADAVQAKINIPLVHIADATAASIQAKEISKVGLLGTHYTMEYDFYKGRMKKQHQISCLVPGKEDRKYVSDAIYQDFTRGNFEGHHKERFLEIIDKLKSDGAAGIILGCTEIPILIKQQDVDIPVFDTTEIHADTVVQFSLT